MNHEPHNVDSTSVIVTAGDLRKLGGILFNGGPTFVWSCFCVQIRHSVPARTNATPTHAMYTPTSVAEVMRYIIFVFVTTLS